MRGMKRPLKPCGTVAAWKRHQRAGEPPCETCKAAHREDMAERRRLARGGARRAELPPLEVSPFCGDPGDREATLQWVRALLRSVLPFMLSFDPPRVAAVSAEFRAVLAELDELDELDARGGRYGPL